MTENNVMEFCQWLMNEKGIEAGNLSDYINNNEEEVLKLAEEFKKPKFKIGGKIETAAEMFKCGGKTKKKVEKKQEGGETFNHTIYDLRTGKVSKKVDGIGSKETYVDGPSRRTLEVFNGDSTIVTKNPNWPESRSRSYEDIMTFKRNKDIGFDTNLRSFNGMKEMFQKKYPNVKSMANGGETDGYKKISDEMGSKESFVRSNGDSVVLTTRRSVYPGFPGTDSLLFVKPMSGDEYIMHNHPTDNDRSWKGEYINTGKSFDPSKIKIEILKDLSKAKLKK